MQPFYAGYDEDYGLHEDERRGMQSLYRKTFIVDFFMKNGLDNLCT